MKPEEQNKGQSKMHDVAQVDATGNIIEGTQTQMSQADWKLRDKSGNLRRLDETGAVADDQDPVDDGADDGVDAPEA